MLSLESNQIIINSLSNKKIPSQLVESDWSSASYFYSIVALSDSVRFNFKYLL